MTHPDADICPTCRLGAPTRHCGKWLGWGDVQSCHEPLDHEGECQPIVRFTAEDFAAEYDGEE